MTFAFCAAKRFNLVKVPAHMDTSMQFVLPASFYYPNADQWEFKGGSALMMSGTIIRGFTYIFTSEPMRVTADACYVLASKAFPVVPLAG
jgi:xanthine/uracil permease